MPYYFGRTDMGTFRKFRLGQNRLDNIFLKIPYYFGHHRHVKLGAGESTWAPLERLG